MNQLQTELFGRLLDRHQSVFIDGEWRRGATDKPLLGFDPSTGHAFTQLSSGSIDDVEAAAAAAQAAFPAWRRRSGVERGAYLRRIAKGLLDRKDELVALQMLNSGKPRFEAEIDVGDAVATFDYYAGLAEDLDRKQGSPVDVGPTMSGTTYFEPLGPVALIVPWNFPMVTTAWKLAPALAAGCTAVLKPSEFTTLAELVYGDLAIEAELPRGVLNIIPGDGVIGTALVADKSMRKVSFTGSNATGTRVMAAAAKRSVPVSLELGGKSPIVVLDDADIEQAVEIASIGIFSNCGQMCSATSRMIVADRVADEVIERMRQRALTINVGSPSEASTEMGPMTTSAQKSKVVGFLSHAFEAGHDCIAGGYGALRDGNGFFVPPTLYVDIPKRSPLWTDEIFGPVMAIRRVANDEAAIAAANDTEFGLAATVVGNDKARAAFVASRIDAGHVWINVPQVIFPNSAWGGFKASGIGRELGPWGLAAYMAVKHMTALN